LLAERVFCIFVLREILRDDRRAGLLGNQEPLLQNKVSTSAGAPPVDQVAKSEGVDMRVALIRLGVGEAVELGKYEVPTSADAPLVDTFGNSEQVATLVGVTGYGGVEPAELKKKEGAKYEHTSFCPSPKGGCPCGGDSSTPEATDEESERQEVHRD
jgi:hypothetical protein